MRSKRKRSRSAHRDTSIAKSLKESQLSTIRDVVPSDNDVLQLGEFVQRYAPRMKFDQIKAKQVPRIVISPMNTISETSNDKEPECREPLPSLVDDIVWTLVQRRDRLKRLGSDDGRNVLTQGYASQSIDEEKWMHPSTQMRPGVVCVNPNDKVNICKSSITFQLLHEYVGDEILRMILLHTMLFVPLNQKDEAICLNYILVCGPPLFVGDEPKGRPIDTSHHPRKRQRQGRCETSRARLPNGTVSRYALFYSDSYIPKVGLPKSHPLSKPVKSDELLGLMTDLFNEKGKKRKKRWKRLRVSGIEICNGILKGHCKCDYARLLNRYCPLPDFLSYSTRGTSVSLPTLVHSFTPSQAVASFVVSALKKVVPPAFWGSDGNFKRVIELVGTFVSLRRQERLPNKEMMKGIRVTKMAWLLGDKRSGSSGSVSDHQTTTILTLGVLRWIFSGFVIPLLRANFHVTESEFCAKQLLYYRKPVWSMLRAQSMKKLLLKQFFEISSARARSLISNQKMGFSQLRLLPKSTGIRPIAQLGRKPVFVLSHPGDFEKDLQGQVNRKRSICDDNSQQQVQHAPKRMKEGRHAAADRTSISSLQRRVTRMPSTNTVLSEAFDVLKYECRQRTRPFGCGLVGLEDFYPRYREYILGLKQLTGRLDLCFVSVDVEKCYDNIDQDHLFGLVNRLVSQDHYFIQKFNMFRSNKRTGELEKISKKIVETVYQDYQDVSERFNGVVFDSRNCNVLSKHRVLELLKEHLCCNTVAARGRFGNRALIQTGGIPQGSTLSTMLCNLYYGDMEKHLLQGVPFLKQQSLLARQVDDFIFVSTNRMVASQFLARMSEGKQNLGVKINREKTLVSEKVVINPRGEEEWICLTPRPKHDILFPWCGMLFDTTTGEVFMDYSRFQGGKARDGLTVERGENEGRGLRCKMKGFVRPRCIPILYDSSINSFNTVVTNYYQMMLFGAVKIAEYVRSSCLLQESNPTFLLKLIDDLETYATNQIRSNLKKCHLPQRPSKFALNKSTTSLLCWRSFHEVFLRLADLKAMSGAILIRCAKKKGEEHLETTLMQAFQKFGLSEMIDY
eukprot:scaffold2195_cov132-Cylindrotheca_fusiformis.AAC.4